MPNQKRDIHEEDCLPVLRIDELTARARHLPLHAVLYLLDPNAPNEVDGEPVMMLMMSGPVRVALIHPDNLQYLEKYAAGEGYTLIEAVVAELHMDDPDPTKA